MIGIIRLLTHCAGKYSIALLVGGLLAARLPPARAAESARGTSGSRVIHDAALARQLKAQYFHEFEAVNRFEGNLVIISVFTSL